jgi:Tol biopolymer transport system component
MRLGHVPLGALSLATATCLACNGEKLVTPAPGALKVTTASSGPASDPDGYIFRLDGAAQGSIGTSASVSFPEVAPGNHTVELAGVASNCTVEGGPTLNVTVTAGATTDVTFAVDCAAIASTTGSIEVAVTTAGGSLDLDGYAVGLDGGSRSPVGVNGSVTFTDVAPGNHTVALAGLAFNCLLDGDTLRGTSVAAGGTARVDLAVACSPVAAWRVLFEGVRTGGALDPLQWDVFLVNSDGSGLTNFSHDPYDDVDPVLSPDHTRVAFASGRGSGDLNIYVANVDGTGLTQLTAEDGTDYAPAWSPDGRKVAFTHSEELHVISADGTGELNLGPLRALGHPASWSPDGQLIAIHDGSDLSNPDIWVVRADGTKRTNLTASPGPELEPAWSPDGSRLAFTRPAAMEPAGGLSHADIWLMNADGTGQRQLTHAPPAATAGASRPVWSPDGSLILFQSDTPEHRSDLFTIRPDGTALTDLTNTADADETLAAWSSDGSRIVFRKYVGPANAEVFIMNADGSGLDDLSNNPQVDQP